ncbi:MAG: flagellar hook-length control protein FliK [Phycisphaerae bacterium]|nr:flagellar hook-length control protein FliK [Phycisphaerae bacterium]
MNLANLLINPAPAKAGDLGNRPDRRQSPGGYDEARPLAPEPRPGRRDKETPKPEPRTGSKPEPKTDRKGESKTGDTQPIAAAEHSEQRETPADFKAAIANLLSGADLQKATAQQPALLAAAGEIKPLKIAGKKAFGNGKKTVAGALQKITSPTKRPQKANATQPLPGKTVKAAVIKPADGKPAPVGPNPKAPAGQPAQPTAKNPAAPQAIEINAGKNATKTKNMPVGEKAAGKFSTATAAEIRPIRQAPDGLPVAAPVKPIAGEEVIPRQPSQPGPAIMTHPKVQAFLQEAAQDGLSRTEIKTLGKIIQSIRNSTPPTPRQSAAGGKNLNVDNADINATTAKTASTIEPAITTSTETAGQVAQLAGQLQAVAQANRPGKAQAVAKNPENTVAIAAAGGKNDNQTAAATDTDKTHANTAANSPKVITPEPVTPTSTPTAATAATTAARQNRPAAATREARVKPAETRAAAFDSLDEATNLHPAGAPETSAVASTAAVSAPAPGAPAAPATPAQQITAHIQLHRDDLGEEMTVNLSPPELGRVRINFRADGDQLTGVIEVENTRTLVELNREAPSLLAKLNEAGISVKDLNFQMNNTNQWRDGGTNAQNAYNMFDSSANQGQGRGARQETSGQVAYENYLDAEDPAAWDRQYVSANSLNVMI